EESDTACVRPAAQPARIVQPSAASQGCDVRSDADQPPPWWRARVGGRRRVRRPPRCGADVAHGPLGAEAPHKPHGQSFILRKEVIQPQVPLRLPCYDLVPITGFTFGACPCGPSDFGCPPLWWL